jgi:hypothetical protein
MPIVKVEFDRLMLDSDVDPETGDRYWTFHLPQFRDLSDGVRYPSAQEAVAAASAFTVWVRPYAPLTMRRFAPAAAHLHGRPPAGKE